MVGPQIEVLLYSIFASKKKSNESQEKTSQPSITPGNFQVSAKLDEESRKDSLLTLSFVISLNDSKGLVTYEFRGTCSIIGSSAEFAMLMEADRNTVPPILDAIYQRLYPVMFLMAGVTVAPYPQSTALASDMVFNQSPAQSPKKVPSEPAAKIDDGEQTVSRARNKTQPPSDASDELIEAASSKGGQSHKTAEEFAKVEKTPESESITVTNKNQSAPKSKVALT